jgi:rubredoxin
MRRWCTMAKYKCNVCNIYEYDSEKGDGTLHIAAGTLPEDFPDDWKCPFCGSDRTHLKPVE